MGSKGAKSGDVFIAATGQTPGTLCKHDYSLGPDNTPPVNPPMDG
jgi:hypothetical protein